MTVDIAEQTSSTLGSISPESVGLSSKSEITDRRVTKPMNRPDGARETDLASGPRRAGLRFNSIQFNSKTEICIANPATDDGNSSAVQIEARITLGKRIDRKPDVTRSIGDGDRILDSRSLAEA